MAPVVLCVTLTQGTSWDWRDLLEAEKTSLLRLYHCPHENEKQEKLQERSTRQDKQPVLIQSLSWVTGWNDLSYSARSQDHQYPFTLAQLSLWQRFSLAGFTGVAWGFQGLDGDFLIPRQSSHGTGKPDPALNTQLCPPKTASQVKLPLCFSNKFIINTGNLFEGYVIGDMIYLTCFALFSVHSSVFRNTFHFRIYQGRV